MSAEKTIRWLHILDVLTANSQGMTIPEIHGALSADDAVRARDLRTIQRDISEMDTSGVVRFHNPPSDTNVQRWALIDSLWGRSLSPMGATTLKMILQYMQGLLPPMALETLAAQEKQADSVLALRAATDPGKRSWNQKVRMIQGGHNLLTPEISEQVMEMVYEALAGEHKLRAVYRRPGIDQSSLRDYSVLALIVRPPKYQLLVRTDKDPYLLNIHCMSNLELLLENTDWPEDFDIDKWLCSGNADILLAKTETIKIHTTRALADYWRDIQLGEGQEITETERGATIKVDLIQTDALRRYLLGLGSQIEVESPVQLRSWLASEAKAMLKQHE